MSRIFVCEQCKVGFARNGIEYDIPCPECKQMLAASAFSEANANHLEVRSEGEQWVVALKKGRGDSLTLSGVTW